MPNLLAIMTVHPLSPPPLPKSILAARLEMATLALALALAGSTLSPVVLMGLLALALARLMAFEVAYTEHSGGTLVATASRQWAGKGS